MNTQALTKLVSVDSCMSIIHVKNEIHNINVLKRVRIPMEYED